MSVHVCESVCACVCLCYSVFECFRVFYACFSFFLCVNAWEHCLLMGWVEGNKLRVLTTIYNDLNVLRVGHLLLHSGSLSPAGQCCSLAYLEVPGSIVQYVVGKILMP